MMYYSDLTGLRAVLKAGGNLDSINQNTELGNAAFFGNWKISDFLINNGAEVNAQVDKKKETISLKELKECLCKAEGFWSWL